MLIPDMSEAWTFPIILLEEFLIIFIILRCFGYEDQSKQTNLPIKTFFETELAIIGFFYYTLLCIFSNLVFHTNLYQFN